MKRDFKYYLLYLMSSFIPFFVLFSHFEIVQDATFIYLCIVLISIIVRLMTKNKHLNKINILLLLGLFIFIVINYQGTIYAFIHIYNSIVKVYNLNNGITIGLISIYIDENTIFTQILLIVIAIQFFISNIFIRLLNKQKYGKLFILSLIFSLPILLVQIEINWVSWVLLITYWFLLYICNYFKNATNQNNLFQLSIFVLVVLSLSCSLFINNFSEEKLKTYYNPITIQKDMFDTFNNWLQQFFKIQLNESEINLNHAKDRIYIDAVHLEVESSSKESMYLKYYSGSIYQSNTWTSLEEENYEEIENSFSKSFRWISKFTFNESDVDTVTIHDLRKGKTFSLYPYYMRNVDQEFTTTYDMIMRYSDKTATFQVWNVDDEYHNKQRDIQYILFVEENYLQIPDDIKSIFKNELALVESKISEEEAKSKIINLLDNYTYTLSPGGTPEGEDFIDYFLTKNKKGYCVHFASAATLMFRYYGIPARYVEGYHVSSSQFDSNGKAEVLDRNAHAWVEIFDNNLGWIPIEVTVGQSEDEETADQPVTPNTSDQNNQQNQNNKPNQNNQQNQNTQQNNPIIPTLPIGNRLNIKEIISEFVSIFVLIGIIVVCLIYRKIRIQLRKKKINQKNRRCSVFQMYDYLEKIEQYSSVLSEEMIVLFEKNKFSKDGLNKEEYDYLKDLIQTIPSNTYFKLNAFQKFKFKYIDCLI